MGEMDEDMEVDVFDVVEVDLDYEFEASRFFDFTREETEDEAFEAELWFEYAKSYPPSPFVANLFSMGDFFGGSVNVSPKDKCPHDEEYGEQDDGVKDFEGTTQTTLRIVHNGNLFYDQSVPHGLTAGSCRGLKFYDHVSTDNKNLKSQPSKKPYMPRSSTLMKPTASQLAKQNPRTQARNGASRVQKVLPIASNAPSGVEVQASKRQKLEGGQLRKVGDLKQQSNLVHKVSRKVGYVADVPQSRLKITIPVEPDFLTSNRAQRPRPINTKKAEYATGRTHTFKARPLNKKILEAPTLPLSKKSTPQVPVFEVFHLKTMERAQQNTTVITSSHQPSKPLGDAVASSFMESVNKFASRLKPVSSQSEDASKSAHSFKARPLDKKLFTSKGDLGVFRNTKRAVTVPKEFDFRTEKRNQKNPLSELFGKLTIAPESGSKICTPSKMHHTSYGPKENRRQAFQQDPSVKDLQKDKPSSWLRGDQYT